MGKKKANTTPEAAPKPEPKPDPPAAPVEVAPAAKPKAKAEAAPKVSAAPKAAAAKAAAEPAVPAAETKAKAKKGKAKAEEPPPPEPEPAEEEAKKKSRRGGMKKKAGDGIIDLSSTASPEKRADAAAEQDSDLIALRNRLAKTSSPKFPKEKMRDSLDEIIKDVGEMLTAKKAKIPRGAGLVGSDVIAAQLVEVQRGQHDPATVEEFTQQFENARASEAFNALKPKMNTVKDEAIEKLKALGAAPAAKQNLKTTAAEAPKDNRDFALKRLAIVKGVEESELTLSSVTIELNSDIMKYLFTPPTNLSSAMQSKFGVFLDAPRPGKGAGKGGAKGAPPSVPKDFTIWGTSKEDVDKAVVGLRALDFSGSQTRENVNSRLLSNFQKQKEIEQECKVFIIKRQADDRTNITILGTKKAVDDAFQKADAALQDEGSQITETVLVAKDKVKAVQNQVPGWRTALPTVNFRVISKDSDNKVLLTGKVEKDMNQAKKQVDDFIKATSAHLIEGDEEAVKKLYDRAGGSSLFKQFDEIRNRSGAVSVFRATDGVQLVGPKAEVDKLQVQISKLMVRAKFEPVKYEIKEQQKRLFNKERVEKICSQSGAEMRVSHADDTLVITGDDKEVAKAKTLIKEVLDKEGCLEVITITEASCKELLKGAGSKIKEFQTKFTVSMNLDRRTYELTILGSKTDVPAAQKELSTFMQRIDKDIADAISLNMEIEQEDVPRIIGTRGAVLRNIRDTCNVQANLDNDTLTLELKGLQSNVSKAEEMVNEILAGRTATVESEAAPLAKKVTATAAPKKKPQEFKSAEHEFPTLGGGPSGKKTKTKAWGAQAKAPEEDAAPMTFPKPGEVPAAAVKEEAAEEEEAGDMDDPFAMMGGMGEEQEFKVTLVKD